MGSHSFSLANQSHFKRIHRRWHGRQSQRQILRSQIGFPIKTVSCSTTCHGCSHYHGKTYGTAEFRVTLICGIYPYGWLVENTLCPDWHQGEETRKTE
ncbi:hypothetical protein C1752_05041 [Acaryochloris thomasi RCC1774]|uniref:Uncharacterized protein n=1 Tax=Acaryochloris thomasi RCC1774 TaxID=1764569 RepID=A0A2W1JJM9_9CYAN|nr:hypothetical protein [Acaryochloris thomasi]PZD71705.1 hypothetical protein C1752_05041 [Acaryochloris thomasi RCC1774]